MDRPTGYKFLTYALILTLIGSIFSVVLPSMRPSYGSHENVTLNVSGDDVTTTYNPGDNVAVVGRIDTVEDNEDVTLKIKDPNGSTRKQAIIEEDPDDGYFDYAYDISGTAVEGVWSVEAEYSNDKMYTYFIVDDNSDTITVELDNSDGIYQAGDEVTISGQVQTQDNLEQNVVITVLDPTNLSVPIVNGEESQLGDGGLADDEFEYSFNLDSDASHGRYAVKVTYDIDNQEGSTLFEILDEDSGSNSQFSGDSDTDGDLSAQIEKDSYKAGDNVAIEGTIDNYDSGDNEDLAIVVEDPNGDAVDDYGDNSATVRSNGDFDYDFDLVNDADEGTYSVTISYAGDEARMTFDVAGGSGSSGTSDLTVKLNKASYLAGETMTVSGTVKNVANPTDEEVVSILLYDPDGLVILEASKYVTPSSNKAYSAVIVLDSDLKKDNDYEIIVSYLDDEVRVNFDITGVSSTPSDEITVNTDKNEYGISSTVKISGQVPAQMIVEAQNAFIQFNKPDGSPCRTDQIELSSTGSYSYSAPLGGNCGVAGKYKVVLTYGDNKGSTTFTVAGASASAYNLAAGGKTYSIQYDLTAGSIKSMFPRPSENKLVVTMDAAQDGKLTLVLPREVIDAIEDGEDIKYVVTVEDQSGNISTLDVKESDITDDSRTLVIDYSAGTDRIEIAGTQVVPEFGALTAIVLAVSIIGIIVAAGRYTNKLTEKP